MAADDGSGAWGRRPLPPATSPSEALSKRVRGSERTVMSENTYGWDEHCEDGYQSTLAKSVAFTPVSQHKWCPHSSVLPKPGKPPADLIPELEGLLKTLRERQVQPEVDSAQHTAAQQVAITNMTDEAEGAVTSLLETKRRFRNGAAQVLYHRMSVALVESENGATLWHTK